MAYKFIEGGILEASTLSPLSSARRPGGWSIDDDDRPHITDLASDPVPAGAFILGGMAFKSDGTLYCTSDAPSNARFIGGQAVRNDGALHITTNDPDVYLGRWGHTENGAACVNTPESILLDGTAWYRSDRLITLNGSTVSAWGDLTGNGNTASQDTEGDQPTYTQSAIGGKPAIQYVSEDVFDISITQTAPIYAFFAVDTTNIGTGYRQILGRTGAGPALYLGGLGNDRKPLVFWDTPSAVWGTALAESYVVRFRIEADGTTGVKVNNEPEVTDSSGQSTLTEWTFLGFGGGQAINGVLLPEAAILSGSAISDAESDSIISYMMSRYSL